MNAFSLALLVCEQLPIRRIPIVRILFVRWSIQINRNMEFAASSSYFQRTTCCSLYCFNSLALHDDSTYFLLPHLSSSGTVGKVPEPCRIFNTYPALYRFLCSAGLLLLIFVSWILFLLPLVTAIVWNIGCCHTFTPSFSSSALFMFNLSSSLLMWKLLSVFVANGAVGQDPEVLSHNHPSSRALQAFFLFFIHLLFVLWHILLHPHVVSSR